MTTVQQQAVAAGFLHALGASPDLYNDLEKIPKHDADAIGAFIAKTLGLAQAPSVSDLTAMAAYANASLQEQAQKIAPLAASESTSVGMMFFMQPS